MQDQASSRADARQSYKVDSTTTKKPFWPNFISSLLATALFRCYHLILFFTGWATAVTLINELNIFALNFSDTLLTVVGAVIGFIIGYRTSASFERLGEGGRLWCAIVSHSRTLARAVWFHVPDVPTPSMRDQACSVDELRARALVQKKTVVNLIEAFSVSVKHYLRGEEGYYYEDLWPLVKYLPEYVLPNALAPAERDISETDGRQEENNYVNPEATLSSPTHHKSTSASDLPLHTLPSSRRHSTVDAPILSDTFAPGKSGDYRRGDMAFHLPARQQETPKLLPSRMPPKFSYFDVFPFSLLAMLLTNKGKKVKGRKAARLRARMGRNENDNAVVSHNVPLEITLYLSSYIAALQHKKLIDGPTTDLLLGSLSGLVGALTGLERILTSPIPFSYSAHLWIVSMIYALALPLQIWPTMRWLTIPGTAVVTFIFFGFIVAGEEIENPFGYDKNDINMDHFTHVIIRSELMAITSLPMPNPAHWAFSPLNDLLFDAHNLPTDRNASKVVERGTPEEWVARGPFQIREALAKGMERAGVVY